MSRSLLPGVLGLFLVASVASTASAECNPGKANVWDTYRAIVSADPGSDLTNVLVHVHNPDANETINVVFTGEYQEFQDWSGCGEGHHLDGKLDEECDFFIEVPPTATVTRNMYVPSTPGALVMIVHVAGDTERIPAIVGAELMANNQSIEFRDHVEFRRDACR